MVVDDDQIIFRFGGELILPKLEVACFSGTCWEAHRVDLRVRVCPEESVDAVARPSMRVWPLPPHRGSRSSITIVVVDDVKVGGTVALDVAHLEFVTCLVAMVFALLSVVELWADPRCSVGEAVKMLATEVFKVTEVNGLGPTTNALWVKLLKLPVGGCRCTKPQMIVQDQWIVIELL